MEGDFRVQNAVRWHWNTCLALGDDHQPPVVGELRVKDALTLWDALSRSLTLDREEASLPLVHEVEVAAPRRRFRYRKRLEWRPTLLYGHPEQRSLEAAASYPYDGKVVANPPIVPCTWERLWDVCHGWYLWANAQDRPPARVPYEGELLV